MHFRTNLGGTLFTETTYLNDSFDAVFEKAIKDGMDWVDWGNESEVVCKVINIIQGNLDDVKAVVYRSTKEHLEKV